MCHRFILICCQDLRICIPQQPELTNHLCLSVVLMSNLVLKVTFILFFVSFAFGNQETYIVQHIAALRRMYTSDYNTSCCITFSDVDTSEFSVITADKSSDKNSIRVVTCQILYIFHVTGYSLLKIMLYYEFKRQ